jgi:hypothetical protein
LDIPNPRTMNFVLGSIGTSLSALSAEWNHEVPPLQALVISRRNELPGVGFAEFAPDPMSFRKAPLRIKREVVNGLLGKVYSYARWQAVLDHFGQTLPAPLSIGDILPVRAVLSLGNAGESDAHFEFKNFVAAHPEVVRLPKKTLAGDTEYLFPSSDAVDVMFTTSRLMVAVEVKSRISPESDILRGIFQCVKYQALLDAFVTVERRRCDTRTYLVLQANLPQSLRRIANTLGVLVIERVNMKHHVS